MKSLKSPNKETHLILILGMFGFSEKCLFQVMATKVSCIEWSTGHHWEALF